MECFTAGCRLHRLRARHHDLSLISFLPPRLFPPFPSFVLSTLYLRLYRGRTLSLVCFVFRFSCLSCLSRCDPLICNYFALPIFYPLRFDFAWLEIRDFFSFLFSVCLNEFSHYDMAVIVNDAFESMIISDGRCIFMNRLEFSMGHSYNRWRDVMNNTYDDTVMSYFLIGPPRVSVNCSTWILMLLY